MSNQHIKLEQLSDLAEGRLAHGARESALAHVHACARCSARLARLDHIISLMRTDLSEEAPRDVLTHAIGLFQKERGQSKASALTRRILAALSFDSAQRPMAFGVRSGAAQSQRQMIFSAGEHDLDLRITASGEKFILSGQVLGPCAGGEVESSGAEGTARAELNDQCEFTLPALPAGRYTLRLRLEETLIEIPQLELGA